MAENHDIIPQREPMVTRQGFISRVWYQFLYKIFGEIFKRISALEETATDHENRISNLEP